MTSSAVERQTGRVNHESPQTIRDMVREGAYFLGAAGIQSARLDAEVLLRHVLDMEKTELYLNIDLALKINQKRRFRELLQRRVRREPVAYITGRKEFWSLDFLVNSDVLLPRPETERLVEIALEHLKPAGAKTRILDLGTGSGAIAVCLATERLAAEICAVDISISALAVARSNAERRGVLKNINFLHGDLFGPIETGKRFHLIVSNPPYVRSGEMRTLAPEVREWEPVAALDGGSDGLDFYRRIIGGADRYLEPGGSIVLEIGADMGESITALFARSSRYKGASIYQDYAGSDRVIAAMTSNTPAESVAHG
jgi:release factor glutamine methyltransferase